MDAVKLAAERFPCDPEASWGEKLQIQERRDDFVCGFNAFRELEGAAITDAAVERACAAHWQAKYPNDTRYPNGWPADSLDTDWADERRKWMRASLEAAFSESHQASVEEC